MFKKRQLENDRNRFNAVLPSEYGVTQLELLLPTALAEALETTAWEQGLTTAHFLRRLIAQAVNKRRATT